MFAWINKKAFNRRGTMKSFDRSLPLVTKTKVTVASFGRSQTDVIEAINTLFQLNKSHPKY